MLILHFLEGLWFPCWLQSASYRRQGLIIWFSGDTCGVPGYYKSASFRRLSEGMAFQRRCCRTSRIGKINFIIY